MRHGIAPLPEPPGAPIAKLAARLADARFVWFFADLGQLPADITPASPAELAEAQSFPAGMQREGWLARRRLARHVLAMAIGLPDPAALRLGTDPLGRPVILAGATGWHLSFAARDTLALVAIGDQPLGVDLELEQPDLVIPFNMLRDDERRWLMAQPKALRVAAFCRIWAAKEAITKAMGTGFRIAPEDIRLPGSKAGHVDIRNSGESSASEIENRLVRDMLVLTREGIRVFVSRQSGAAQGGLQGTGVAVARAMRPGPANPESG
jgi:4'-phosphopantetheinyl transferase